MTAMLEVARAEQNAAEENAAAWEARRWAEKARWESELADQRAAADERAARRAAEEQRVADEKVVRRAAEEQRVADEKAARRATEEQNLRALVVERECFELRMNNAAAPSPSVSSVHARVASRTDDGEGLGDAGGTECSLKEVVGDDLSTAVEGELAAWHLVSKRIKAVAAAFPPPPPRLGQRARLRRRCGAWCASCWRRRHAVALGGGTTGPTTTFHMDWRSWTTASRTRVTRKCRCSVLC
jgi:hypothetical protein